jgi:hypothetical protein
MEPIRLLYSSQKTSNRPAAASLQLRAAAEAERRRRGLSATAAASAHPAPELRGAAAELARAVLEEGASGEYMLAGPAETGKTYSATHVLDALEGVLKERLRYGRWVSAEGVVYAFDKRVHLVEPFYIPQHWRRIRVIDFGYTNPFVCLWIAIDPDGRMIVYRQLYKTQTLVADLAEEIKAATGPERIEATIADPEDAEGRATLARCGVPTVAAFKALSAGIQATQKRLALAGDGRPRLMVVRGSLLARDEALAKKRQPVDLVQEFDAYVWPAGADGKLQKEAPIDAYNHALDGVRYGVAYVDRLSARTATGGAGGSSSYLNGGDHGDD